MKRQNKLTVILGRKGSGKSYLANKFSKDIEKIVIFDPVNYFKGGIYIYSFDELKYKFAEIFQKEKYRVVLKFTTDLEFLKAFDFLFNFYGFTLLIDEAQIFAPAKHVKPEIGRYISYGRHRDFDIIITARRPYEIHRLILSQADEVITFIQHDKRDLEYLQQFGFNPEKVKSLKKYQYLKMENS